MTLVAVEKTLVSLTDQSQKAAGSSMAWERKSLQELGRGKDEAEFHSSIH